MNGATLKKKLISAYGEKFYYDVARELDVDQSTVYRWCAAKSVPKLVAAWITAHTANLAVPPETETG